MATTRSQDGRRFDEEFKREVAAPASRPGAKQPPVARDLSVSPSSGSRWQKLHGQVPLASPPAGVSRQ